MGHGYVYQCKKCGEKYSFSMGCGFGNFEEMQLFDLNSEYGCILDYCDNKEEKENVKKMVESGKYHLEEGFGYKILKCDKCGKYYNKFIFELYQIDGNDTYQSNGICTECKARLRIIDDDKIDDENLVEKCEKCGGTEFDKLVMMWD